MPQTPHNGSGIRGLLLAPLAALLTFVMFLALTPPASANTFGWSYLHPSGCCTQADNRNHYYNYSSLTSYMKVAGNYAMIRLDSQTDMATHYDSSPDSKTDVEMFDQYYDDYWGLDWNGSNTGKNIYAHAKCVRVISPGLINGWWKCDQYEIRFDLADMSGFSENERKHTACHEVGHSVGLGHSSESTSCLKPGRHTVRSYSSHDVAHINGRF
ncbi:matrixin family metalloprotease [Streptosporangium roseum]|uniref:matrixin family metalloprotease n=1 Tax=Streptosporangium roseum TaxID=2001 RepID=UPI0033327E11